ncbi:MAG TPA: VOC family protein [Alphaproteobacteria bacterium]|nr:VOC family protein [Alphaproteobacteria bacterium]
MNAPFQSVDHVQLAMPPSREDSARAFYSALLGMAEIPKPADANDRRGCWFASGDVQIHLGVEEDFRPARKAHPALRCADYDALLERLRKHGTAVREDDRSAQRRAYIDDPFGNRIELIAL